MPVETDIESSGLI